MGGGMRRRPSLKGRISLVTGAVLALGLAALITGFNVLLHDRLDADATAVLHTRAQAQRATLVSVGGRLTAIETARDEALDRSAWVFQGAHPVEEPTSASP